MRGEFIDVGGKRLYYYAAGTRGAGDPIVLIHGFPTSSHLWSELVPLLPRGHRVVVLDLLGYGRSDRGSARSLGIGAHADRLVGLLDALGIRTATLVGHHLGGGIAQQVAVRHPERVGHLALLHPVGLDAILTGRMAVLRAFLPLVRLLPTRVILRVIREEMEGWYGDPLRARHSIDQFLRPFGEVKGRRALLEHFSALDVLETGQLGAGLSHIAIPVAIVGGAQDRAIPPALPGRLQRLIPGASLDIFADVRHYSPEEAPERVSEIVERLVNR